MNIAGGIVVFTIVWWTVFFAVLPWDIKSQWEEPENMPPGTDPGAPVNPQLKRKALRTTWITAIIWLVIELVMKSGLINLRQ